MIFVENGQVYEKTTVETQTQIAEVITYKCPEFKVKLSYASGKVTVEYLDWQDNHVNSNSNIIFRFANYDTSTNQKVKSTFIDGFFEYEVTFVGECSVSVTVEGTDGGSLFFEV